MGVLQRHDRGPRMAMTQNEMIRTMNDWGNRREPFIFLIDFDVEQPMVRSLAELEPAELLFDIQASPTPPRASGRKERTLLS